MKETKCVVLFEPPFVEWQAWRTRVPFKHWGWFYITEIPGIQISYEILNGVPILYVDEFKHLGNLFQSDNSMTRDCKLKRAKFISIIHSLNQEFNFSEPTMVVKLYNIYASSVYGSNLWDLFSVNTKKL